MVGATVHLPPVSSPQYVTTDWYLASFVLCQGIPLTGWRRIGPKKVEFRFPAGQRLHDALRLYWAGVPTIVVPAHPGPVSPSGAPWCGSCSTTWFPMAPSR